MNLFTNISNESIIPMYAILEIKTDLKIIYGFI